MDINEYIRERLDPQIDWYDNKSIKAQAMYKKSQFTEIILAAFIPLLSGYTTSNKIVAIIVGVFGSIIAIIEAISKLNKYHENWIQYRSSCELLKYQKHLYLTHSYPYNPTDETIENVFIKNIENIISSENNQWKNINTVGEDKNGKNSESTQ